MSIDKILKILREELGSLEEKENQLAFFEELGGIIFELSGAVADEGVLFR